MPKVLIVDDEEEIVEMVRFSLTRHGYKVLAAGDGTAAIDILKNEKPDLLILDVMLPGVDGYTLQLQISQDEELQKIPVIVLTAYHSVEGLFDKFLQVKNFIAKPFDPEFLAEKVKEVLEQSKNE